MLDLIRNPEDSFFQEKAHTCMFTMLYIKFILFYFTAVNQSMVLNILHYYKPHLGEYGTARDFSAPFGNGSSTSLFGKIMTYCSKLEFSSFGFMLILTFKSCINLDLHGERLIGNSALRKEKFSTFRSNYCYM